MTFGVGIVFDAAGPGGRGTLAVMEELFEPVDTGRRYLNFVEEPTDPARFFEPTPRPAPPREGRVRPVRIIRANHPIRPAVAPMC